MNNNDIISTINEYKNKYEGKYWNAGITPTKENWGVTNYPCGNTCTSNTFGGGRQCFAFARFIAYLLTDTIIVGVDEYTDGEDVGNGWIKKTDLTNVTFEPGDMITTAGHTAIVWKVERDEESKKDNVSVIEAWGSVGCKIAFGDYNGGWDGPSTVSNLNNIAIYVLKCPKTGVVNPPIPTQTIKVTFKKNETSDGGTTVETRTYTVGGKYDPLPTVSRTGYNFNGWWPERQAVANYTRTNV